jgi:uncharacterized protein
VPEFVGVLVDFSQELRASGVAVGSGEVLTFCSAMAVLDPSDLIDLYWGGRTTLVSRRNDLAIYDAVFRRFFLGGSGPAAAQPVFKARVNAETLAALQVPETEPGHEGREQEALLGLLASDVDVLKGKAFTACTADELAALRRIMTRIRLTPPKRRTRRTVAARSGRRPDLRRTMRESLRMHGDPASLFWRTRKTRLRPLILILDVSGSMADYSRSLLQFAYSAKRAASRVEVFCFGTRLTRITRALEHRRLDDALELAATAVFDWDGGTRIGESLDTFVRDYGRRGLCRGGIVVICSDGLDRGDPSVLSSSMERLSRLCHRVVWMNPHQVGSARPNTLAMMVAEPYIDLLLPGRDLRSLEELAAALPALG